MAWLCFHEIHPYLNINVICWHTICSRIRSAPQ